MESNSITDYLQSLHDIIPAIQMGLFPDPTIGTVYHVLSESDHVGVTPTIFGSNLNPDPFNDAGAALYLSSASATDTQYMYIEGILHSDGTIAAEYKYLNGQTAVQLTNVYRTILRAYNANGVEFTADAYIGSEPTPTLGIPATDNIYAHIPATYNSKTVNSMLTSVFTVPVGYTAFITNWYSSAPKGKDIELMAYARSTGHIFMYKENLTVYQNTTQKTLPWLKFPAGTDFKVNAITTQGTQSGAATFDVVLLLNEFINKIRPLAWR